MAHALSTKPSQSFSLTDERQPKPPLKGLDAWANRWVGRWQRHRSLLEGLREEVTLIEEKRSRYRAMTELELSREMRDLRDRVRRDKGGSLDDESFGLALLRELAWRRTGLEPYPVQLLGALALRRGLLAEMATGEGKTLTAVLAGILAGWTGKPCHIVTVNDYLATRDADWYRQLYQAAGLRVAAVTGPMEPPERRQAYAADVVYITSKELLADYLRDRMVIGALPEGERRHLMQALRRGHGLLDRIVMRGIHTAIVDEVDSVLIDEAATPLILSSPSPNPILEAACRVSVAQTGLMAAGEDYEVDERYREVRLLPAGRARLEATGADLPGIWRGRVRREELARQALTAHHFYQRDREYIIDEGKIVIVDPGTGRAMPGRSWRQGLHQMIEAREGVELTPSNDTSARLSFQRFFRLFHKLSGMTGTAYESADEFWHIYGLTTVRVPTHRPVCREIWAPRYFRSLEEKWQAVAEEALRLQRSGRPLLIGARTVEETRILAGMLEAGGVDFQLLNAVDHEAEAQKITRAGRLGQVTVATNMAGRGTDICLADGVADLGGLHVLSAQRNESGRVDRQMFGRCARQGDPGTAQVFASLEDYLPRQYFSLAKRASLASSLEVGPGSKRMTSALDSAQKRAQHDAAKRREQVLEHDIWIDESLGFGRTRF